MPWPTDHWPNGRFADSQFTDMPLNDFVTNVVYGGALVECYGEYVGNTFISMTHAR